MASLMPSPTVAAGIEPGVKRNAGHVVLPAMSIANAALPVQRFASVAVTVNRYAPAAVGVPEMKPLDPMVIPGGRMPDTENVYGARPPLAPNSPAYEVPTVPLVGTLPITVIAGQDKSLTVKVS